MKKNENIVGIYDVVENYVNYKEMQVKSTMEHQTRTLPIENFMIRKIKMENS